jgi:hypothetical protein
MLLLLLLESTVLGEPTPSVCISVVLKRHTRVYSAWN